MNENNNVVSKNGNIVSSQVADYLMEWIKENGLKSGDKIPPELELTKILNIGRSSVREAIATLKSRNIVEGRRGCGTFLSDSPGVVEDPLGLDFFPDKTSLAKDWGIVRLIIEPSITELAAINATPEDIDKLMESWEILTESRGDPEQHFAADSAFHELLAEATHNVVIMKLFPIIQEGIHNFMTQTDYLHTEETRRLHHDILKAVVTHDAAKARAAMELLICANQDLLGS